MSDDFYEFWKALNDGNEKHEAMLLARVGLTKEDVAQANEDVKKLMSEGEEE